MGKQSGGYHLVRKDAEVMMRSCLVRGLIAGAILLSLAGAAAGIGVFEVSDVAAAGTFVTLLLLLGFALFDESWESAEASGDAVTHAAPLTVEARIGDASSTAA
jgi:hypothetical protein